MAKDEPGRLLSKVAKFVRNPLKDWSELDADEGGAVENGYSREMLKEMIERRQRNDFVRRREFDMLRKLRRREAAGGSDGSGNPSAFNVSSTSGKTEGRALTLKKIDEIEEQMSQQWWKNRGPGGEAAGEKDPNIDMAAQHARAYADTMPGQRPPEDAIKTLPPRPAVDGSVEEAAIRFAHGDDAGTEAILLQALSPGNPSADKDEVWLTLFDFYRATGDEQKFAAAAARYGQRMRKPAPAWLSLRALAAQVRDADRAGAQAAPMPPAGGAVWSSPPKLTRESLLELTRALAAAGPEWKLDWQRLESIDLDAAGPLRALFAHWADSPVQLRFGGAESLRRVLAQATPANQRAVELVWWQLHMATLRMLHRGDDFELLALNYCITYEVSPPAWEEPKGSFAELEAAKPAAAIAPPDFLRQVAGPDLAAAAADLPTVSGELTGESLAVWERLDAQLAQGGSAVVSCAALVRLDFAAAGTLLNWVSARDARGKAVHFTDVQRLVAAFFGVIGIANHAEVAIRAD